MSKHAHKSDKKHSESEKKDQQKQFAEDLVYTLNHAIVCGTTDIIDPFIGNWTQKKIGSRWRLTPFKHEHGCGHHHHHGHHHEPSFWGGLHHWVIGEAIGDIGAVPVTLAMQHYTPWAMKGIQVVAEPALGPLFKWSSERYARKWAEEHGIATDAPEVQKRAQELYQHEVSHLPHAFVWTASAAGLNVLSQKYITRSTATLDSIVAGKATGSLGTLITVLGLRSLFPRNIEKLDKWNTKHVAEPATRKISKWLGIDDKTVNKVLEEEHELQDGHKIITALDVAEENRTPAPHVMAKGANITPPELPLKEKA